MPAEDRPFTGAGLDRAVGQRKDPAAVKRLLSDPAARAVIAGSDGVLVEDGALRRVGVGEVQTPILLGIDEHGRPLFALEATDGEVLMPLREAGVTLSHDEGGLAAYAASLLSWHRRHRFCANCGTQTIIEEAGLSRRCPSCGAAHFPRTDPVVIMAVEHEDRLLLGRRAGAPEPRRSVLAGFVSPGESAEEAVIREVHEEAGITARDPRFVASQPWPFPSSLMLGFEAQSDGAEPIPADGELADIAWFSRDEVRAAVEERNPRLTLPPRVSIARFLIERWAARRRP